MDKRNLIIISHLFPNKNDNYNGIFVYDQLRHIQKLDKYNPVVICPVPYSPRIFWRNSKWRAYGAIPKSDVINGVEVFYPRYLGLPGNRLLSIKISSMYNSILAVAKKYIDNDKKTIIHSNTVILDGSVSARIREKYKNVRTVCTGHGSDINVYPFRSAGEMEYARYSLKNNDRIITVSQKLKEKSVGICGDSKEKITVLTNGVDDKLFQLSKEDNERILELKNKCKFEKTLVFVGNLVKEKGVYELVNALAKLKEICPGIGLIMVGGGKEKDNLVNLSRELGIEDRVVFTGKVKHEEVKLYMNLCDIFVLPSYSEGMPTVMFEAMASKKPIVITRVGGVEEIIDSGVNGVIINPKSSEEIIDAVSSILSNDKLFNGLADNAYKSVMENYTWEKNVEKLDEIYEDLLRN